ncbi:hypothetical protein ACFRR6_24530 [Streptomyces sp. NPDC056891]|uniref:hypothetical protein n=1 Tax=Streptomyces sp. NPDC056891 TaxID=3345961 RepID=UPI0036AE3237
MTNSTATLHPAPMAGDITLDHFRTDEKAGFEQLRHRIGSHQDRETDLNLIAPVPVSSLVADDIKHLLHAPGFRLYPGRPRHVQVIGHPGGATVRVTLEIAGGVR